MYVVVPDADAVYAKARDAGARIALDIKDEDHAGRGFSCSNLEGVLGPLAQGDLIRTSQPRSRCQSAPRGRWREPPVVRRRTLVI